MENTAVVPVLKKGSYTVISEYRPVPILNSFSFFFEFIIYDHLYVFFKYRLNPSQHVFRKHNSTSANLVACLNTVVPSLSTQGQTGSL
jgi:hypothetical protein